MYSTFLVAEFPTASVLVTVTTCRPGVVSSGDEPWLSAQVATPEKPDPSLQLYHGVTTDPAE
jgi:hypothetical protein